MDTKNLKILMIGTDRNLVVPGSAVSQRAKDYANLVEELHIVLLSDLSHGLKDTQLGPNVWVYPTNSSSKYFRPLDAARIGNKVVFDKKFTRGKSVITTQDPFECGWAGMKIKKKWRLPLEVQIHTNPFSVSFGGGLENTVRKFFMKKILRSADGIRVVNQSVGNKVSEYSRGRVMVLPIFIDREAIEKKSPSFDLHTKYPWQFILLSVGRLAPEKNLTLALEVLARVRDGYDKTGLVIVGSGPEEERLKSYAKKLGISEAVDFVGWQDDLVSYYKTANAFIQTSAFEGYGMALVEAGLSGLPVVTTPVGIATKLIHTKDALIFPPNRDMFAGGIADLIQHNDKRKALAESLKKTLETELITKEKYLEELVGGWGIIATRIV